MDNGELHLRPAASDMNGHGNKVNTMHGTWRARALGSYVGSIELLDGQNGGQRMEFDVGVDFGWRRQWRLREILILELINGRDHVGMVRNEASLFQC